MSLALFTGLVFASPDTKAETIGIKPPSKSLWGVYTQWRMDTAEVVPASTIPLKKQANAQKNPLDDTFITDDTAPTVTPDPLEPVNRFVFGFNEVLETVVLKPVTFTYRTVVPQPVRGGIANVVDNARAPVTFANDLLQGKPKQAQKTFMRFLVNSTVGFGGFVDAAQAAGLEPHHEDFGQTLAVWGVGSGPYLVAPVFGPSTPRHLAGRAVDTLTNPLTWILWDLPMLERSTPLMADIVTGHDSVMDDLENLRKTSPDLYASVRDIYLQKRKSDIANGTTDLEPLPEIPDIPAE